ncbi:uncharacterized protein YukE [Mycobacterium sp. OAS707]|jgi:uncharacterized protein YukE|uniref:WXG100 family type VII secretion target n=1 Tax=unclassified Mycobacterium TaxID=2642494 RepID=UPI00178B72B8|nr:WXG100 family type VII secretion target [Mycobacterium sp. OAS707]MBE1551792.1 uncharacterized protein YukE [Mycobacterium sp. OAS707]
MTEPGGGTIKVNAANVHNLANTMDDVSQRMQDVLNRYQHANEESIANQTMGGNAAMTSVATGAEIHDAQTKIQHRFQQVNDTLRQAGSHTTNTDHDNSSLYQQVAGAIKFQ